MKKFILPLIFCLFAGCGKPPEDTFKIGVPPGPQKEIVAQIQKLAAESGFSFTIVDFSDYAELNSALKQKKIDVNVFQNIIYLESVNQARLTNFLPVGKSFVAPLGLYSSHHAAPGQLPEGAAILLPDDRLNIARCLWLLEKRGLLALKPTGRKLPDLSDIQKNPRNLKLQTIDSSLIIKNPPAADAVFLSANYAAERGLSPGQALFREDGSSLFTQLIVARPDNQADPRVRKFVRLYNSPAIKNFIQTTYQGRLLPAWQP